MDCERNPKPAYFAYREALTPLMVNLRTDRFAVTAGERLTCEAWICNDTHAVPEPARIFYQVEVEGRPLVAGEAPARVEACRSTFQGAIAWRAPAVPDRATARLRLALVDREGKVLHATALDVAVFAPLPKDPPRPVVVIGPPQGKAARLARRLGRRPAKRADLYLIEDLHQFAACRAAIAAAVRNGATAVFLQPPIGSHEIAGTTVTVSGGIGMHFASRATGHPLVADFRPDDFRLWYDADLGRISPFLFTNLQAAGWAPILASGTSAGVPALAAAERVDGGGVWRLCLLELDNRVQHNPVARRFASALLRAPN